MPAERTKTSSDSATSFVPSFAEGYAAWLGALSPFPDLSARTADLVQETRRIQRDAHDHLRRVAELQLATAQKALAADHPAALAEISSQWTAETLGLASAEVQRRGEALSRMMGLFRPVPARP